MKTKPKRKIKTNNNICIYGTEGSSPAVKNIKNDKRTTISINAIDHNTII